MNYSIDWDGPGERDREPEREPDHPLDICYCGDYRKDHKYGTGVCMFSLGAYGDGHSGAGRCDKFVFAYPHTHRHE